MQMRATHGAAAPELSTRRVEHGVAAVLRAEDQAAAGPFFAFAAGTAVALDTTL